MEFRAPKTVEDEEVLAAIRDLTAEHGFPPTTRELGRALRMRSTASMHVKLKELKSRDLISWVEKSPRTLKVL